VDLTTFGLILAILGILVTVGIAIRQRRPKRVTYEQLANRRIITRTAYQASGALVVKYGDRSLADPYLVVVRVANGGKVEIRPDDWEELLSFSTGSEIVDSGVVGTSSKDLRVDINLMETNCVTVDRMLLNPGEWFDIQMFVDGPGGVTEVSARIAGAKLEPSKKRSRLLRDRIPNLRALPRSPSAIVILPIVAIVGLTVFVIIGNHYFGVPMTSVPQLTGLPVSKVVEHLHHAKLHLGEETFVPSPGPAGIVVDQHPGAGSRVETGGQVSIVITQHG
jgi:hypothetical protein